MFCSTLPTSSFQLILFSDSQFLSNIPMGIVVDIETSLPITVSPLVSVEQNSGFLAGHTASQNKDYISQPPLWLSIVSWLSSSQWKTSKSDLYNLRVHLLANFPFPFIPLPDGWNIETRWATLAHTQHITQGIEEQQERRDLGLWATLMDRATNPPWNTCLWTLEWQK